MCAGLREDGSAIDPNDPHWAALTDMAQAARERPRAWLDQAALYGDLPHAAPFAEAFDRWLTMLWREGTGATLETYTSRA
jgi:mannitol 2-dehydrogenase